MEREMRLEIEELEERIAPGVLNLNVTTFGTERIDIADRVIGPADVTVGVTVAFA